MRRVYLRVLTKVLIYSTSTAICCPLAFLLLRVCKGFKSATFATGTVFQWEPRVLGFFFLNHNCTHGAWEEEVSLFPGWYIQHLFH